MKSFNFDFDLKNKNMSWSQAALVKLTISIDSVNPFDAVLLRAVKPRTSSKFLSYFNFFFSSSH